MARDPFADPFATSAEQALGGDGLAMTFDPFESNEEPPPLPKPKPKSKDTKTAGDVVPLPFPRSPMPAGTIPYSTHGYENADPDAIARGVMGGKVKVLKPTPGKEGELEPRTRLAGPIPQVGAPLGEVISAHPVMQIDPMAVPFHAAGPMVSGLVVRKDIPNLSSISSSFHEGEYTVLRGIREVPFSAFEQQRPAVNKRSQELAKQIGTSGEINPLIVVIDKNGPYILEGSNRFDALMIAGHKSFPALVVMDHASGTAPTEPSPEGAAALGAGAY